MDISRIMSLIDPNKAATFLQKNQAALRAAEPGNHGCHSVTSKFFIARKDMSSIDKAVCDTISSKQYFRDNIPFILDRVNQAQTNLLSKAKA